MKQVVNIRIEFPYDENTDDFLMKSSTKEILEKEKEIRESYIYILSEAGIPEESITNIDIDIELG